MVRRGPLASAHQRPIHAPVRRRRVRSLQLPVDATAECAEQPQDDEDHDNEAEDTAEAPASVLVMRVIAAPTAEQQKKDNDDQYERHVVYSPKGL